MDIQQYIAADKELLLNLNGSQSLFWDGFMWVATSTIVWVPVAAMLLYIIIKNNKIQEALLTIVMIALVITLADQIASGSCKPFFARFRPTQDPNRDSGNTNKSCNRKCPMKNTPAAAPKT